MVVIINLYIDVSQISENILCHDSRKFWRILWLWLTEIEENFVCNHSLRFLHLTLILLFRYSFQQGGNGVGQPFSYAMPHFGAPPTVPENAVQDHPANAAEEQVQPQQPQVVRMNAQGGRVDNDEDEDELDRDWLDWFYIGLRFALFMCILYFYSTPVRFITTLILMLFICWCVFVRLLSVICCYYLESNPVDTDFGNQLKCLCCPRVCVNRVRRKLLNLEWSK